MKRLLSLSSPAFFHSFAAVGGKEEKRGRFGEFFDFCAVDDRFGATTWEKAEGELESLSLAFALKKGRITERELSLLLAGDLQNQCEATSHGLAPFSLPFLGLYGACSTAVEGLGLGSLLLSAQPSLSRLAVVSGSHNSAAERQFRTPLEYGGQRTPTAQWTATAAGAFILSSEGEGARVCAALFGRCVDGGVKDASNMGAAMAPAAADTLLAYFRESGDSPADYDAIVTGDLGQEGSSLLSILLEKEGLSLGDKHQDCGCLLYDESIQDVHAGASGCGCIASLLACHFIPQLERGSLRRILAIGTGAMMNPAAILQGDSILGVAHLIKLEGSYAD